MRRALEFGRLYQRQIKSFWTVYLLVLPVVYAAMMFLPDITRPLLKFISGLLMLSAPLTFCRRDNTLVRLAPVSAGEKLTFYLLYVFIFVPVVLDAYYIAIQYVGHLISPEMTVTTDFTEMIATLTEKGLSAMQIVMLSVGSYMSSVLIITAMLYGALTSAKPLSRSIINGILAYLAMVVTTMIFGFIMGFTSTGAAASDNADPEAFGQEVAESFTAAMPTFMFVIGLAFAIISVIVCIRLYRKMRG